MRMPMAVIHFVVRVVYVGKICCRAGKNKKMRCLSDSLTLVSNKVLRSISELRYRGEEQESCTTLVYRLTGKNKCWRSNIRSHMQRPIVENSLCRPVSQTVMETEVDEKWAITEGFNSGSVITLQISDFPSFIYTLFIAAAFLSENKMISLRQYNARNNRFGQTFAEAWWAWLTIAEFHCGFSLTVSFPPSSIYSSVILNGHGFARGRWRGRRDGSTKERAW